MTISFDLIPEGWRVPGVLVEINKTGVIRGLTEMPSRVLFLGQKLTAGLATAAVPVRVIDNVEAETQFGVGSMLARMFAAYKRIDRETETWAIPMADAGAGVAASGTIVFSGTVSAPGTLNLYIAGRRVRVAVAAAQSVASIATAVGAAITADASLPVTASVDTATVTITARHKGENGNAIDVRVNYWPGELTPAGLVATITPMASGAGNPDITAALTAMADDWYTAIVMPYTDSANMVLLEAALTDRFGPLVAKDAVAFAAFRGTYAQCAAYGAARNSRHVSVIGAKLSPTPPEEWAAAYCAQAERALHNDPARPLKSLELTGIMAPAPADRFSLAERNLLLHDGISTFTVGSDGLVALERAITTYQTNAYDIEDPSFLDVTTPKTLAYIRFVLRAELARTYPRFKIADDGTRIAPGAAITTPGAIKGTAISVFRRLEDRGIVEQVDAWKSGVYAERHPDDPTRVNLLVPPDIVNPLHLIAVKMDWVL